MYCTLTQVKTELNITTTTDDTILTNKIAAAQAEIDRQSGRTFEAVTTTKYYNEFYEGLNTSENLLLLDDDLLTVTTLTNGDGTVIPSSGYWLEPQNLTPYSVIRLKSSYSWSFSTDGQISILGTWGKSATAPSDIVNACIELAVALYRLKDTSTMTATVVPDAGATPFPIALPKHVQEVINSYRKLTG
jgi:hypothetical protein